MPLRTHYISEVFKLNPGVRVRVAGWVHKIRDLGGIKFVILRDRSGIIQVVVKRDKTPEAYSVVEDLVEESVVTVEGVTVSDRRAPGGIEILASSIKVLNKSSKPLPLNFERDIDNLGRRLDWRFIDLRSKRVQLIFIVESEVANAIREYFRLNGFIEIFTSKIVAQATEGGANVFPLVYFGREAFLAQSPQLYKQLMMATGVDRVFEIGPVFRAEKHHTVRHLCEYHSVDYEMAFIKDYSEVMDVAEGLVRYIIEYLNSKMGAEIESVFGQLPVVPKDVPRITFREACRILKSKGRNVTENSDLTSTDEEILAEYVRREYDSDLFFITEYPWSIRPFYTMRKDSEPQYTYSFDLILRGLEVATGGQREHRYSILVEQIKEKGLNPESFKFYTEYFKYGMPPHGGAGFGLERLVMKILNLKNIREARLTPRDPERLHP
ncbi:MAG TPA: aspartate--tRNA(Asn) ligase [Desulfurococcales archaeon]|nr:aspartate--tRNA(Asn) ligase [Desulfurococcales archaeon]